LERAPERVLADVRGGYVSLEAARRDYGVVIQQNGRHFELEIAATVQLRQEMRNAKAGKLVN
jgi:N-methylhydantoinase B